MADGTRVGGETNITASTGRIKELHLVPRDVQPLPQTLAAIASADLIESGPAPCSSVLFLVHGIPEAVAASPAVKVLVCNLMTEANESLGLSAADHIQVLTNHARTRILDYALVNATPASAELKIKYAEEHARQIVADVDGIEALGVNVILRDYLEEVDGMARHATHRVSRDLLCLLRHTVREEDDVVGLMA